MPVRRLLATNRSLALALAILSACGGVEDTSGVTSTGGGGGSTSTGTGGGGGTSTTCTDTWSSYGASFFSSSCRTCHEHTSAFGTQSSVQSQLSSISSEISTGKMPEGTSLSSTEKARILAYLACGAP